MNFIIRINQFFRVHPRLILANIAGLACFLLLPDSLSLLTRGIVGWNILAWVYILLLWFLMVRTDQKQIQKIACLQDESAFVVLMMVCLGSIVSLVVIFVELSTAKDNPGFIKAQHLGLTFSTLMASWLLVPTAFSTHYAHLFYMAEASEKPISFPEQTTEPHYWDFIYFSFTIAVASQTADVAVCTPQARRIVLLQSILSFIFNISILGLCINVTASLV